MSIFPRPESAASPSGGFPHLGRGWGDGLSPHEMLVIAVVYLLSFLSFFIYQLDIKNVPHDSHMKPFFFHLL